MIKIKNIFFIALISHNLLFGRSIYRPLCHYLPRVIIYSSLDPKIKFSLFDSHIRLFPLFEAYNHIYLEEKKLPTTEIAYRNSPTKKVSGKVLYELLERLVQEVLAGETEFTDFKILKKRDFNVKIKCGLIVLKFKQFPFVAKLFLETPRTLARPYSKGILPMGMFVMGGTNRHLNGFTRIKNMENIKKLIEENPEWRNQLSVPRKWFWTPQKINWIHVDGFYVGQNDTISTKFPAIYAVIADEIIPAAIQPPSTSKRNLPLCQKLGFAIDPNHNNFIVEKETNKLALYDTEHFPTLIGEYYRPLKACTTYVGWYIHLARKFLRERIFATKQYQENRQTPGSIYPLY